MPDDESLQIKTKQIKYNGGFTMKQLINNMLNIIKGLNKSIEEYQTTRNNAISELENLINQINDQINNINK